MLSTTVTIITEPSRLLHEKCLPWEGSTAALEEITANLLNAMMYRGYGLAAPQLGVNRRVAVVATRPNADPIVLVNPEITFRSPVMAVRDEACLSLPGIEVDIWRSIWVRVTSDAWKGERRFSGLTARAIQHEVDHLEGILITDRAEK